MKYLAFRIAQFLARSTPRPVAYWIGDFISWFHFRFDSQSRRAVLDNLSIIHRASGQEVGRRQLRREARDVYRNFAKYIVDFFTLFHFRDEERRKLMDLGDLYEVIQRGLDRGKGVITVTAHMGNWELGGASMCMGGFKVNAVALVQADPKLNELFQSQRLARGMQIIPLGQAAKPSLRALRRNEVLAVVGDRDFTATRLTVNFFGQPARVPHGPAQLAVAMGSTIITAVLVRNPDDTYQLLHDDPIIPDGLTVEAITNRVARALESFIGRYPTQWYLFNHFWDIEEDLAVTHGLLAATMQPSEMSHALGGDQ